MSFLPLLPSAVRSYLQRFFITRAPRRDSVQLNLRNVYIFFSRSGALFAVLLICTFIAGVNYGNNLVLGLCFYMASVWVISLHLTFAHVSGLQIDVLHTALTQQGSHGLVTVRLNNNKAKPSRQLLLRFDTPAQDHAVLLKQTDGDLDHSQKSSAPSAMPTLSTVLPSVVGEHVVSLPVGTKQRGKLTLPKLVVSTVYPLGIMQAWSYVYFAKPLWVYPKPLPFKMHTMHVIHSEHDKAVSLHGRAGQHDFDRLDEYSPGESLARVSWSHFARGQGMLSKHFADPMGQEQRLDYADMPAHTHEDKLSQLSFAVLQLGHTSQPFQLNLPGDMGQVGQGDAFVQKCLLRLAKCP